MPNSSCIVPQCTTSDAVTTAQDNASSVKTPIIAGRTVSVSQPGRPNRDITRGPTLDPTPIRAPSPWIASTPPNARNAFGVCSAVITDAAS